MPFSYDNSRGLCIWCCTNELEELSKTLEFIQLIYSFIFESWLNFSSHIESCKDGVAFRRKGSKKLFCLSKETDIESKLACVDDNRIEQDQLQKMKNSREQ